MYKYFLKRFFLIFPTLFFIIFLNFMIIQIAPGGPVEKFLAQINHQKITNEVSDSSLNNFKFSEPSSNLSSSKYLGSKGVDPDLIKLIEKNYGFDLPIYERFFVMIKKFISFDFGESFYQDKKITNLILEKMPVSISLGFWSVLFTYLLSIPLGIKKALNNGSKFDLISSSVVIFLHSVPAFLIAIFFIVLFCGGNFLNIFPLRGIVSQNFEELNYFEKILDYIWHLFLPILSMVIGGFASLTFFCKNSFLEEINKNYVLCAKAKGLSLNKILYFHIFRNALMIVIASLPSMLVGIFFTSSLLIEVIFSLDGLGLLSYEAIISRDYPLIFASLYFFTILGLVMNIVNDLIYHLIDPRIHFEKTSR
ncbi:MAG: microcin C ABC transporter permease YejB [Alphaproteobacteria bacterium]